MGITLKLEKRHLLLVAGAILLLIIILAVSGMYRESMAVASVSAAAVAIRVRERSIYDIEKTKNKNDTEVAENEVALKEMDALSAGIEDSEARYLETIEKMTPEDKKKLAKKLSGR
jgi:hypothetical protein